MLFIDAKPSTARLQSVLLYLKQVCNHGLLHTKKASKSSRKYDSDSHFQILIPLCTDSIFNAPRPERSKPVSFARVERVHRLDEPDRADGNQLLLLVAGDVVLLHDVRHEPEIVED